MSLCPALRIMASQSRILFGSTTLRTWGCRVLFRSFSLSSRLVAKDSHSLSFLALLQHLSFWQAAQEPCLRDRAQPKDGAGVAYPSSFSNKLGLIPWDTPRHLKRRRVFPLIGRKRCVSQKLALGRDLPNRAAGKVRHRPRPIQTSHICAKRRHGALSHTTRISRCSGTKGGIREALGWMPAMARVMSISWARSFA